MPKPTDFEQTKFPISDVLYDHGGFSVAFGLWERREEHVGMRWNGEGDQLGFPSRGQYPTWFLIPPHMTVPYLKSLLEFEETNKPAVERILVRLGAQP